MEVCSDIRPGMRITLMNWLAEVHHNFHLAEETLYLAVSIIDQNIQVSSHTIRLSPSFARLSFCVTV